jgi:hypothetical protein
MEVDYMISLELAEKLKDAGLKWEPKEGDWFYLDAKHNKPHLIYGREGKAYFADAIKEYCYMAPSLSQLLAEIEGRGYEWSIGKVGNLYLIGVKEVSPIRVIPKTLRADTPEDAAAGALIWILEREKDGN